MKIIHLTPSDSAFPDSFRHLPQPPKKIFILGNPDLLNTAGLISIVGARKASHYGQATTDQLAYELSSRGLTVVSGLALGIDSIAHRAALRAGGKTIAVLPTAVSKIYPASHYHLAKEIIDKGGALISEYAQPTPPRADQFIARNRLIAALGQGTLIPEAALKSGSLHTARFALEQGKTVLSVPGNITSALSEGTNNLIKAGAVPVTKAEDVLHALGFNTLNSGAAEITAGSEEERTILELIKAGTNDINEMLSLSGLPVDTFNMTLSILEINGQVRPMGGGQWSLSN